jgi:hypothetical protein
MNAASECICGLIPFDDLLSSPLPPLNELFGRRASPSHAKLRRNPTSVREWSNFIPDLLQATHYHGQGVSRPMLVPPSESATFDVASEVDVQHAFILAAGSALDRCLRDRMVKTTLFPRLKINHNRGLSVPDFASAKLNANGTAEHLLCIGEVKRPSLAKKGDDLVAAFATDTFVIDALQQLTGYQIAFNCKYSFLTCYTHTWASCLEEDGTLQISPAFKHEAAGPLSALRMMLYVLDLSEAVPNWLAPSFLVLL